MKNHLIGLGILLVGLGVSLSSFSGSKTLFVQTVRGPMPADSMGLTLIHEHVLVDFIGAEQTGYHRWDREKVSQRMLPYLKAVKEKGLKTMLECTPAYLGRDPLLLEVLSRKSGIQLLTNTGYYGAVQDKYVPAFAFTTSVDSLADIWIGEFENGIEGTGIKPGFIKIAVDVDSNLSSIDEKILRAAILTHKKTGLTIVSHTGPDAPAYAQADILTVEGLSLESWVWTHAQNGSDSARLDLARKGAWISIDNIHRDRLEKSIFQLLYLKQNGVLDRVLISHDAGWYRPDEPLADNIRGYTDIFTHLLSALEAEGFSKREIEQLLIKNPKEAYAIRVRTR